MVHAICFFKAIGLPVLSLVHFKQPNVYFLRAVGREGLLNDAARLYYGRGQRFIKRRYGLLRRPAIKLASPKLHYGRVDGEEISARPKRQVLSGG